MRRGGVVLLVLALLAAVGPVDAQAPAKVKLGVLKLTSSAVLFLGVEKGYFKEFGIEPELVYFQAAQPIAVAALAPRSTRARAGTRWPSRPPRPARRGMSCRAATC